MGEPTPQSKEYDAWDEVEPGKFARRTNQFIAKAAQHHNRFIQNVAETQALLGNMTWEETEAVTSVRFKLLPGAGATPPTTGDIVRVVFDPAPVDDINDNAQAWSWLQAAGASESLDVEYAELIYIPKTNLVDTEAGWSRWFEFGAPLRRASFLYVDGSGAVTNMDIIAETE